MSNDRRFEYEKGPRPEDVQSLDESEDGSDDDPSDERDRLAGPIASLVAGLVSGVAAFATMLAITYQLVASKDAAGYYGGAEGEGPTRWVMTRLTGLANHGAPIEVGGEPMEGTFAVRSYTGLASDITALVPVVVLLAVGYLLVRYVRLESRLDAGVAVGSSVASYVVLAVVIARNTEWTPEGDEAEPLTVATDAGAIMALTRTALVFVVIGAAVAALPRILEAAPLELTDETD